MIEIIKLALSKGWKYESLAYVDSEGEPTGEFMLRVFNTDGVCDITARITTADMHALGMEVLET